MAIPDASTVVQKWQQRSSGAAQDYAQGVANTDKDPTALAIANGQRYISQVQAAFNSGKWANNLRRTGKSGWQNAVATKGVNNYTNGIQAAGDKALAAFTSLLSFESGLQRSVQSMPSATDADRENRMLAWVRGMRQYSGG